METLSILDQALNLAELGLAVFPVHGVNEDGSCTCGNAACDNIGKHPRTGSGCLEATVNVKRIKGWFVRWPDSNIGVATGEKSGIVVLDVDGQAGLIALGNRSLPTTPAVATGRTEGGTHYYFQWPGFPVKNLREIGKQKGLDFRGDGGYVVVPGSRHKSGNRYYWVTAPEGLAGTDAERVAFAEAPDWLAKAFNRQGTTNQNGDWIEDESAPEMVVEGMRDVTLTSLAGTMHRRAMPRDVIRNALLDFNARYCKPPLADEQVIKVADSINRKPKTSSKISITIFDDTLGEVSATPLARDARLSDVGNAEVFTEMYGEVFRHDHDRKKWIVWIAGDSGEGAWREDTAGYAERGFMAALRMRDLAANAIPTEDERKALRSWVNRSESQQGIPNGLRRASTLKGMPVKTTAFDVNPLLFNTINGTLNLETMEHYPAESGDFLSRQAPVKYLPHAEAPRWRQFISEIFDGDEALAEYFQRAMGYTMTGLTKEQALFVCHGNGANGKSTALGTINRVLGSYAAATPFDTFEADNRNQYGNDLAALKGKRYVMASESEATRRLAEARVKLVTGQDPISCRFLYGEYFEYIPQFKVWVSVNHKPGIRGTDHGIWRRIHLLPFTVTFGNKPGERPMDKDLDVKLADELPGVLNWLIEGYQLWTVKGLNPPQSVMDATAEYKRENDSIAGWLEDRIAVKANGKLNATEGYTDFRQYMSDIGEVDKGIPTMKAWSIAMAEKGFTDKKRTAKGYEYQGICLGVLSLNDQRGN